MGAIESSCVFDLDATISASYSGSGTTWANYEDSPADGSGQTAYDMQTGDGATGTTYPTFNGSAGDAAAYWSFDGGDYFSIIAGMTSFAQDLHKTTGGTDFWIAFAAYGFTQRMFSTQNGGANSGITCDFLTSGARCLQRGAAGVTVTGLETSWSNSVPRNSLVVISHSHSGNNTRIWVDGVEQGGSHTFSTSTINAGVFEIGRIQAGTYSTSGVRLYGISGGNSYIDSTAEAAIRAEYETRHARSYTRDQTPLNDAVASTGVCFQLDTHLFASTHAGGFNNDWKNACTSPTDGETQSTYDFADVSAPSFVGWGTNASAPYWNPAAGDYWQIAANTTTLKNLHKTTGGQDFWLLFVIISDGATAGTESIFSTTTVTTATSGQDGITIGTTNQEDVNANQSGTAGTASVEVVANGTLTSATHLIALSYSHSNNNWRVWVNSTTSVDVAHTFAASIIDAVGLATIGAESDGGGAIASDYDWKSVYFGNSYLDDDKMAEIIYYVEELHNADYTGDAIIGTPPTGGQPHSMRTATIPFLGGSSRRSFW